MDPSALNATRTDEFYLVYANVGPSAGLVSVGLVFLCLALVGNGLNALLICVTVRNKSLRGTSNYLLALNSLLELLQGTGHYLFVYSAFSGRNFVPLLYSVLFEVQALFGYAALMLNMVELAADRFLSLVAPKIHHHIAGKTYLCWLTFACAIPGALYAWAMLKYALQTPNEPVTGHMCDLEGPAQLFRDYSLCMLSTTVCIYAMLGAVVLRKGSPRQHSKRSVQVLKSLIAICLLMVCANVVNLITQKVTSDLLNVDSPVSLWYVKVCSAMFANISGLANAPILYAFSARYRRAFRHELRRMFGGLPAPKLALGRTNTTHQKSTGNNKIKPMEALNVPIPNAQNAN